MTWHRLFWACSGGLLLLTSGLLRAIAQAPAPSAYQFVLLELLAGVVYLVAVWRSQRDSAALSWWYVLVIGIGCRLLLLTAPVLFDDDIHRYLWDGNVLAHGVNPYRYPPLAEQLWTLRDENWARIGYPQIRTIYPPMAQCLFAGAWLFGLRTIVLLKCLFFLFDVANMLLISLLLRRLQRPVCWALIYAWSPLASKEFANSGHLEPVLLFFMLLLLICLTREKGGLLAAGTCWGLAILTKFIPLLWAPLLWRVGRWRVILPALLVIGVLYLPFLSAGRNLFSGVGMYSRYWTFNYGAFGLLSALQHALLPGLAQLPLNPLRGLVTVIMIGYALFAAKQCRLSDPLNVLAAAGNTLAVCLLLSPTIDPWYVCWLLPFLCFTLNPGLLLWTVTCLLSYLYYAHGTFPVWIPLAEYLPVALILLGQWIVQKRRHRQTMPIAMHEAPITSSREPSQK